jgi:parallel beta-helix repeat protein
MLLGMIVIVDVTMDFSLKVEGATHYVNKTGSGGAYTSIQDAINASIDGDTVYVYNGTYFERITVDKTINLMGEDKESTIIDGRQNGDVVLITADYVNLTGFNVTNSSFSFGRTCIEIQSNYNKIFDNIIYYGGEGIYLSSSSFNEIYNNSLSSGYPFSMFLGIGIYSHTSPNNNISMNNFTYYNRGINLLLSPYTNISENRLSNNNNGIFVSISSFSNISNNYFSNNEWGLYLDNTGENVIKSNNFTNDGIFIESGQLRYWNTHYIENNSINGKPIYYFKNESSILVSSDAGQIILANCSYINISGFNISNVVVSVILGFSDHINISNNSLHTNNWYGIFLKRSFFTNIDNNKIYYNKYHGIYLGSDISLPLFNNISNNIIFSNDLYGIYIKSYNNSIFNNIIYNNTIGISFYGSMATNNFIYNNSIHDQQYGIYSDWAGPNFIYRNSIFNHQYGISLDSSDRVLIYNNNLENNTNNAIDDRWRNFWNYSYPIGGNYWDIYTGSDNYKGPNQNIPGSDGIGDTPYVIDADSQDNYPLMKTYEPLENYTILNRGWNLISIPLIQEEENLTRVLGSIDGWYDTVQWYKPSYQSDPWKHNRIGKPFGNDLFKLNETMGFWIRINQLGETIFLYNGTQPTQNQTIQLHTGWNMVGYPSLTNYNRTTGLNNLTFNTHIDAIWTYNASSQKYKQLTESDYFEIGKGYYIHAKTECTWVVPL